MPPQQEYFQYRLIYNISNIIQPGYLPRPLVPVQRQEAGTEAGTYSGRYAYVLQKLILALHTQSYTPGDIHIIISDPHRRRTKAHAPSCRAWSHRGTWHSTILYQYQYKQSYTCAACFMSRAVHGSLTSLNPLNPNPRSGRATQEP